MDDFLTFALVIGGWIVLRNVVLPRLGVPT